MPKSKQSTQNIDGTSFALAEYSSLRNEMLKQQEFQHQIITLSLVVAGTFLSLGSQEGITPIILLIYPILVVFIVLGWARSNIRIQRIKLYIEKNIESKVEGGGWENYLEKNTKHIKRSMTIFHARGVFIGTQLTAMLLALLRVSFLPVDIILLAADAISIVAVIILIRSGRKPFI